VVAQLALLAEAAQHSHGVGVGRYPGAAIHRGVADHQAGPWRHAHALGGEEDRVRVGLGVPGREGGDGAAEEWAQPVMVQEVAGRALVPR
jgi:hypothetical protein